MERKDISPPPPNVSDFIQDQILTLPSRPSSTLLSSLFSCLCVPVSFSLSLFTFFIFSLASFDILCVCVFSHFFLSFFIFFCLHHSVLCVLCVSLCLSLSFELLHFFRCIIPYIVCVCVSLSLLTSYKWVEEEERCNYFLLGLCEFTKVWSNNGV